MPIFRCGLAVIQKRGERVTPPSADELEDTESDFLLRHVGELRSSTSKENSIRARFREDSSLEEDFRKLLSADISDDDFLEGCEGLVNALAEAMKSVSRAEDCVVAILTSGEGTDPEFCTLLKLDAELEAANLEEVEGGGIRLRVFQHLMPAPGKMQKGLSWPDPRRESELIFLDTNRQTAAQYFQDAFGVEGSPRPVDTEKALSGSIAKLGSRAAAAATAANDKSGPVEQVAEELRVQYPDLDITPAEIGGAGALGGTIRRGSIARTPQKFQSDGITLSVPLGQLDRVSVRADGPEYVTTIRTSRPLGPYPPVNGTVGPPS